MRVFQAIKRLILPSEEITKSSTLKSNLESAEDAVPAESRFGPVFDEDLGIDPKFKEAGHHQIEFNFNSDLYNL